jgi:hypothetical protein
LSSLEDQKNALANSLRELSSRYGEWTFDIPLPYGVWTKGNLQLPHTRLKRIVQIVSDLCAKPLSECRILDLACLDGLFSIEFAKHGAETVGVEIREANIKKAMFCKEALQLTNLTFRQDDVRNVSSESYGTFDAIICSGILYHLEARDVINLCRSMYNMVTRVVVIDTHVSLWPVTKVVDGEQEYVGRHIREHADGDTPQQKATKLWASADNTTSFWFTRPSLVNLLTNAGFSSVYECFAPVHLNFGKAGLEHPDRCTFVAVKAPTCETLTSPSANFLKEKLPEGSLEYSMVDNQPRPLARRLGGRLRRLVQRRP